MTDRASLPRTEGFQEHEDFRVNTGPVPGKAAGVAPSSHPPLLYNSVSLGKDKQTQEGQGLISMQCGGSVIDISKEDILETEITIVLCCPPNPWHPQFKLSKTNINTVKDRY